MALIRRFLRLFQADLHGVIDRLEEPEILLKQALREMEEELERGELALKKLSRERDGIVLREEELAQSQANVEQELDLCFEADNEALARTLLKRQLEMEKLSKHLARKLEELDAGLRERRVDLAENRSRYESVRQKAELLKEENQVNYRVGDGGSIWLVEDVWRAKDFSVRDEEVEIALLKEKERRAESGRKLKGRETL